MAIPTWVTGQVLTASDVNTWFVPFAAIKPADTARATNTTLAADPDIVIPVATNANYQITGIIVYDGGTGGTEGDIKWAFTVPSGSSGYYGYSRQNLSGSYTGAFTSNWTDGQTAQTTGVGTFMTITISGMLATSSTGGNLVLTWAQNTSSSANTRVRAQTFLTARRIG